MAGFLKVLFRNLLEGPSTDPFPLGETFTPARLRGRAKVDPTLCMGAASAAMSARPGPSISPICRTAAATPSPSGRIPAACAPPAAITAPPGP